MTTGVVLVLALCAVLIPVTGLMAGWNLVRSVI